MKLTLSHNDKSWLSFDLKDLFWLALVIGVWATLDYRTKYTNNVLKYNEDLQQKLGLKDDDIRQLKEQIDGVPPNLMNMVRLEEQSIDNVNRSVRYWSSMSSPVKVGFLNQLQAVLDAVNKHRDVLTSTLGRLKAENK
jgi:hypothetical protein